MVGRQSHCLLERTGLEHAVPVVGKHPRGQLQHGGIVVDHEDRLALPRVAVRAVGHRWNGGRPVRGGEVDPERRADAGLGVDGDAAVSVDLAVSWRE